MELTCPFCSGVTLTDEHVIPKWMSRKVLTGASPRAYFTLRRSREGTEHRSRMMNLRVRVCAECNNGWMSKLELAAKPILLDLAVDRVSSLGEPEQSVLARWLFKTALTHEAREPMAGRVSTQAQREQFRLGQIPAGWSARVARAEPSPHEVIGFRLGPVGRTPQPDGSTAPGLRLVTMRYGALAAQVLLHSLDEPPTVNDLLGGPDFSATVFPSRGVVVTWPPGRTIAREWWDIVGDMNMRPPDDLT